MVFANCVDSSPQCVRSTPAIHQDHDALLVGGSSTLLQALLSHAIDKGTLPVAVYFFHEIAVALWVGALLGLDGGGIRGSS
jgi:hypothetical protein